MNTQKESEKIKHQFTKIANQIIEKRNDDSFYHRIQFNTNQLINHQDYSVFPNSTGALINQFEPLNNIKKNDCLYWFELENEEKTNSINSLLNNYRLLKGTPNYKTVPATNNNKTSNVLYVGVRQGGYVFSRNLTNIVGRINQHLGYYSSKSTQGLQLYEYAKDKDYCISIKVIEFEGLDSNYLNIIEKLVAKEFKPLCGRH